jgi:hypothetical protein
MTAETTRPDGPTAGCSALIVAAVGVVAAIVVSKRRRVKPSGRHAR